MRTATVISAFAASANATPRRVRGHVGSDTDLRSERAPCWARVRPHRKEETPDARAARQLPRFENRSRRDSVSAACATTSPRRARAVGVNPSDDKDCIRSFCAAWLAYTYCRRFIGSFKLLAIRRSAVTSSACSHARRTAGSSDGPNQIRPATHSCFQVRFPDCFNVDGGDGVRCGAAAISTR